MIKRRPVCISIFSGAGGLDIGLEQAGFRVIGCTDNDDACIETLETNKRNRIPVTKDYAHLQDAVIVKADITQMSPRELLRSDCDSGEIDLLAGGPPCQSFSIGGKRRSLTDPRGMLYQDFARFAMVLKPRFILFENVRGLVTAPGPDGRPGTALKTIIDAFIEAGYKVRAKLLNSADYGLPQRRVRLFILGSRDGVPPDFPKPTHVNPARANLHLSTGQRKPWVSLEQFMPNVKIAPEDEIIRPTAKLLEKLGNVPEGCGLKSRGKRERTRPGGHWGYTQGTFVADRNKPSRTVTASNSQDWVRENNGSLRRLTVTECKLLQGFPEKWEFTGNTTSKYRQIGNAVPSVFGNKIGDVIMGSLNVQAYPDLASSERKILVSKEIVEAIKYTEKEQRRNGFSRGAVFKAQPSGSLPFSSNEVF